MCFSIINIKGLFSLSILSYTLICYALCLLTTNKNLRIPWKILFLKHNNQNLFAYHIIHSYAIYIKKQNAYARLHPLQKGDDSTSV